MAVTNISDQPKRRGRPPGAKTVKRRQRQPKAVVPLTPIQQAAQAEAEIAEYQAEIGNLTELLADARSRKSAALKLAAEEDENG